MVPRRHRGDRFLRASARPLPSRRQTRLHERRLNTYSEVTVAISAEAAVTDAARTAAPPGALGVGFDVGCRPRSCATSHRNESLRANRLEI